MNEFAIEASILYGNIAIYAAFDRKPKISGDHDFTNTKSIDQDLLEIVSIYLLFPLSYTILYIIG